MWWHFAMLNGTTQRWVYNTLTGGFSYHVLPGSGVVYSLAAVPWAVAGRPTYRPILYGTVNSANSVGMYIGNVPNAVNDCGTAFRAYVRTRAWQPGTLLVRSEMHGMAVEGDAISGASLSLALMRDYGLETSAQFPFTLTTSGYTIAFLGDARLGEMTAMQIEYGDAAATSVVPWRVTRLMGSLDNKQGANV